jgi:ribosomal-protein-alanine N-acetyltransferase
VKIELRKPLIADAKRYLEILSHPEFTFLPATPKSLKEEQNHLRRMKAAQQKGSQHDFAIIVNNKHIGGAGIKINQQFPHICEIGYFLDYRYWNRGIATQTVGLLEHFIAQNLPDIIRIEIVSAKKNAGSCKVAIKSGYKKEGLMRRYLKIGKVYHDSYRFAKILK